MTRSLEVSLRLKLALLLSTFVGGTLFVAWAVTGRTIIQPFTREVLDIYLDEVVYVADQVSHGMSPSAIGRELNLDVRIFPNEPPFIAKSAYGRGFRCQEELRKSYKVVHCRGRRAPVAVRTDVGWVVVRRDIDIGAPGKRIGQLLLFIGIVVFALSAGLAAFITRPLKTTTQAMERMAAGDLTHRLPASGGRELMEAARAFNAMADRVDSLLSAERELMAGISHELRTPLARLRVELEILRDSRLVEAAPERTAESREKRFAAMEADLEEIDALIGELLESSRLSLGERRLERERVELTQVIGDAIERNPLSTHRVTVEIRDPVQVLGDRARLVRVVGNLLQNAGKYAPEGSEIHVSVQGTSVTVLDQGPGVPPSDLERMFEPFYRGAHARAISKKGGLGLGLMIARQLVRLHGGWIAAENRPEGGLAITFQLPPAA